MEAVKDSAWWVGSAKIFYARRRAANTIIKIHALMMEQQERLGVPCLTIGVSREIWALIE